MHNSKVSKAFLAIILLGAALISGCGGGGGTGSSGGLPITIGTPTYVLPSNWSSAGGPVTLKMDVFVPSRVSAVIATIIEPDGTNTTVDLAFVSGNTFAGTYVVPANLTSSPVLYSFTITATDKNNNSLTSEAVGITALAAMGGPPKPPPPVLAI